MEKRIYYGAYRSRKSYANIGQKTSLTFFGPFADYNCCRVNLRFDIDGMLTWVYLRQDHYR